jgi:hypothetical protein
MRHPKLATHLCYFLLEVSWANWLKRPAFHQPIIAIGSNFSNHFCGPKLHFPHLCFVAVNGSSTFLPNVVGHNILFIFKFLLKKIKKFYGSTPLVLRPLLSKLVFVFNKKNLCNCLFFWYNMSAVRGTKFFNKWMFHSMWHIARRSVAKQLNLVVKFYCSFFLFFSFFTFMAPRNTM